MRNSQWILAWSTLAIVFGIAVAMFKKWIAACVAVFGDGKYAYRFDKSRLPMLIYALVGLAVATLSYGLFIGRQLGLAVEFSLATTFFGGIGLVVGVCYVGSSDAKSKRDDSKRP